MKHFIIIIITILLPFSINAKFDCYDSIHFVSPTRQYSPILLTAGYRVPVNKSKILNSGKGLFFEAGVNAGYFFQKKSIVAPFIGWAWKDRLWSTNFSHEFIHDMNLSNSEPLYKQADSLIINGFINQVNHAESKSTLFIPGCGEGFHTYSFYYGLAFRLPLNRFISLVKIYSGETRSSITLNGTEIIGEDVEYNHFEIRRKMVGGELSFIPNFKKTLKDKLFSVPLSLYAAISLYYEQCYFSNATLFFSDGKQVQKIRFNEFLSSAILNKYKTEQNFGVKLSLTLF